MLRLPLHIGRSPAVAAFTVSEHAAHGALQLLTGLASSAVTGAAGLAKTALIGRQDGYRAGTVQSLLLRQKYNMAVFPCMEAFRSASAHVCIMSCSRSEALQCDEFNLLCMHRPKEVADRAGRFTRLRPRAEHAAAAA